LIGKDKQMKSIKLGRGPSTMGVLGSAAAIVIGIVWTIGAYTMTRNSPFPIAGVLFPLFGVVFVVLGVVQLLFNLQNAVSKNRMSIADITDSTEELDPLNRVFGGNQSSGNATSGSIEDRLKRLESLRVSGAILEDEYQAQRKRVLNEL
jgi:hypothetical protein